MISTAELYRTVMNAEPNETIALTDGLEVKLGRSKTTGSYRGYSQNEYSGTVVFNGKSYESSVSTKKSDFAYSICAFVSENFPDSVGPMSDLEKFLNDRELRLDNEKKEKERKAEELIASRKREEEENIRQLTETYEYAKRMLEGPTHDKFAYDADNVSLSLPKSLLAEFGFTKAYVSSDAYEVGGFHTLLKPLVSKKCDFVSAYEILCSMIRTVIRKKEMEMAKHLKETVSPLIYFGHVEGRIKTKDYVDRIKYSVKGAETLSFTQYDDGNVEGLADVDINDCYLIIWKEVTGWTRIEEDDFGSGVVLVSPKGLELLMEFEGGDAGLRDLNSFRSELENGQFSLIKVSDLAKHYK